MVSRYSKKTSPTIYAQLLIISTLLLAFDATKSLINQESEALMRSLEMATSTPLPQQGFMTTGTLNTSLTGIVMQQGMPQQQTMMVAPVATTGYAPTNYAQGPVNSLMYGTSLTNQQAFLNAQQQNMQNYVMTGNVATPLGATPYQGGAITSGVQAANNTQWAITDLYGLSGNNSYVKYWGPGATYNPTVDLTTVENMLKEVDKTFASTATKEQFVTIVERFEEYFMNTHFTPNFADASKVFKALKTAYDCIDGGFEKVSNTVDQATTSGATDGAKREASLSEKERAWWQAVARLYTAAINNYSFVENVLKKTIQKNRELFFKNYFKAICTTPVARRFISGTQQLTGKKTYTEDKIEVEIIKEIERVKKLVNSNLSGEKEGEFMGAVRVITKWVVHPDLYRSSIGLCAYILDLFDKSIAQRLGWGVIKTSALDNIEYFIVTAELFSAMYSINIAAENYKRFPELEIPGITRSYKIPLNHLHFAGPRNGTFYKKLESSQYAAGIKKIFGNRAEDFSSNRADRPTLLPSSHQDYFVLATCAEICSYIRDLSLHPTASTLMAFLVLTGRSDGQKGISSWGALSSATINILYQTIERILERVSWGVTIGGPLRVTINITGDYSTETVYEKTFLMLNAIRNNVQLFQRFTADQQKEINEHLSDCREIMQKRRIALPVIPQLGTWIDANGIIVAYPLMSATVHQTQIFTGNSQGFVGQQLPTTNLATAFPQTVTNQAMMYGATPGQYQQTINQMPMSLSQQQDLMKAQQKNVEAQLKLNASQQKLFREQARVGQPPFSQPQGMYMQQPYAQQYTPQQPYTQLQQNFGQPPMIQQQQFMPARAY